tara:strand:- start:1845 stop:2636 length:792 start_codon:yes stop_codon:yes gene_type:complete
MAIIYSYPQKTSPSGGDFLVITDSAQPAPNKNRTKSLTIDNLAAYVVTSTSAITGSGTLNTIPIFTGPTTIGDSIITYDVTGNFIQIGAGTTRLTSSSINADVVSTAQVTTTNIFGSGGGTVTLNGNTAIGDASTDTLTVEATSSFKSRININESTSSTNGLAFNHPAGGSSGVVNMYYNGAVVGSKFVISRSATGGAEIELQANGDVNLNRTGNGNILLGNLQSLADEAAAQAAGLAKDTLYQTDGSAAAPLNVKGIVMVKQ